MRSKGLAIRLDKDTLGDSPCFDSLKAIRLDKDSRGVRIRLTINVIIREIQDDSP